MQGLASSTGLDLIADYAYDPQSRRTSLSRAQSGANGVTAYDYSQASRLTGLNFDLAGTSGDAAFDFGYNRAGQVNLRSIVSAYEWTVDDLDQTYVRDGLNLYTSVGGVAFGYDARQNLTSDSSRSLSYDLENRLLAVTQAGVTRNVTYDTLGRLRTLQEGANTFEFVYDGDRLVLEYNSSGGAVARRYVHGPGVDEPLIWYEGSNIATPRWLIADRQGSIVATTDSAGAATIYSYGPYGEPHVWGGLLSSNRLSRFRYTGQAAFPELELYHYKARVYDPVLGRFLQTDPVGYEDDLNLYMYVGNDPLNGIDPSGEERVGLFIGGEFTRLIGARGSLEISIDTESFEINAQANAGYTAGARLTAEAGVFVEPSQTNGVSAAGALAIDASVAGSVRPSGLGGEIGGRVTLVEGSVSTVNGLQGDAMIPEAIIEGGIAGVNIGPERVEFGFSLDVGGSASVNATVAVSNTPANIVGGQLPGPEDERRR